MVEKGISPYLRRQVEEYLKSRSCKVKAQEQEISFSMSAGVPQGSVLGPLLWVIAFDGMLRLTFPEGVQTIAYADDLIYVSASSVAVSAWTLVAISVERYYAICHPLRSRRWQTLSHAYRLIALIWLGSLITMLPISLLSRLIPTNQGLRKCREIWPNKDYERGYNILLDVLLFVLPLVVLTATYSLITRTLWRGIRPQNTNLIMGESINNGCSHIDISRTGSSFKSNNTSISTGSSSPSMLRRSNTEKALLKKKRVVKMLFAVVLEFFICWTPLYVINTVALFDQDMVYNVLSFQGVSYFQLLAYASSCCNSITYCFMNSGFRKAFLKLFGCLRRGRPKTNY
ncbi:cholecystokinin receptor-like [Lycorma delicatula]|uniref:cholecystokinin receptor-like n=1 Tax=Lycorma delicatula TaxID=130591 RepID=UPI003F51718F